MSDLYAYIYTAFLGSSKTNIMELFRDISSGTRTDLLLLDSGRYVDESETSQLPSSVFITIPCILPIHIPNVSL